MSKEYNKFSANMVKSYEEYEDLSREFNIPLSEIIQIDLNRSGIF